MIKSPDSCPNALYIILSCFLNLGALESLKSTRIYQVHITCLAPCEVGRWGKGPISGDSLRSEMQNSNWVRHEMWVGGEEMHYFVQL